MVAAAVLCKLERTLHEVAQAILDVGRERLRHLVLEVGDADGLGDDFD